MLRNRTPLLLLLVLVVAACGASQREKTINATALALRGATTAFLSYDEHKQADIVNAAPTLDEGKAALQAYREKRAPVQKSLETAYTALGLALVLDSDADQLTKAVAAAVAAQRTWETWKGAQP